MYTYRENLINSLGSNAKQECFRLYEAKGGEAMTCKQCCSYLGCHFAGDRFGRRCEQQLSATASRSPDSLPAPDPPPAPPQGPPHPHALSQLLVQPPGLSLLLTTDHLPGQLLVQLLVQIPGRIPHLAWTLFKLCPSPLLHPPGRGCPPGHNLVLPCPLVKPWHMINPLQCLQPMQQLGLLLCKHQLSRASMQSIQLQTKGMPQLCLQPCSSPHPTLSGHLCLPLR